MESNNITNNISEICTKNQINWYCCGPTIYNNSHLGHARTYVTFDMIRRILINNNHNIKYAMNITNVDDKIIKVVTDEGLDYMTYINKMEKDFFEDIDKLNIIRPDIVTRVTDYVTQINDYISKIIENGYAYIVNETNSNASVYFDYQKYVEDGCDFFPLGNKSQDFGNVEEYNKKHPYDFALWKARKSHENIYFNSDWGQGRPGWHIECSAMCESIFSDSLDLHTGGIDLLMPHHNNEIVQHIAYHNTKVNKWCNNFVHIGPLTVNGKKMSQSLKNFITIRDFLTNIGTSDELRMLFALSDWQNAFDYTNEAVLYAKNKVKTYITFLKNINEYLLDNLRDSVDCNNENDLNYYNKYCDLRDIINTYLYPNFNIRDALKNMFDIIKLTNNYMKSVNCNKSYLAQVNNFIKKILINLGFNINDNISLSTIIKSNDILALLVKTRQDIRNFAMNNKKILNKQVGELYNLTDYVRTELASMGISIEDK